MSGNKIRIMIVDDHPLFRQGVRRVLEAEEDLEVIMEASDGEEALRMISQQVPNVVLMDVNLPGMNGLRVTQELKAIRSEISVIILTAYHNEEQIFHCIRAGASAYFPKDVTPSRLIEAIYQVHNGNYVIDDNIFEKPEVAAWLLKQFDQENLEENMPDDLFTPLSSREMEILQLIARGRSNKEIALDLGISRQTVKNHMTNILRKLAVNDRTQAALYALRRGWIRLQDTN